MVKRILYIQGMLGERKFSMRKFLKKIGIIEEYDLARTKSEADFLLEESEKYKGVFIEGVHIYPDTINRNNNALEIVRKSKEKGLGTVVLFFDFGINESLKNNLKNAGADKIFEGTVESFELKENFDKIFKE